MVFPLLRSWASRLMLLVGLAVFFAAPILRAQQTSPAPSPEQGGAPAIASARTLYDQGKFQDALEKLRRDGLQSASDYYNAGNCLYRLGKLGQALAYYEKAQALAPTNSDIDYNLTMVEDLLNQSGSLPKDSSVWTGHVLPLLRAIPEAGLNIALALLTAAVGWFAVKARKRSLHFRTAVLQPGFIVGLSAWLVVLVVSGAALIARQTQLAAISAETTVVRSGPSETFTELLRIPAGAKVEITGDAREGWRQIRFSLGNVGWVVEKDLIAL